MGFPFPILVQPKWFPQELSLLSLREPLYCCSWWFVFVGSSLLSHRTSHHVRLVDLAYGFEHLFHQQESEDPQEPEVPLSFLSVRSVFGFPLLVVIVSLDFVVHILFPRSSYELIQLVVARLRVVA